MTRSMTYLADHSIFEGSIIALFLIVGLDMGLTLLHTYQEWKGEEVPLWRVFGAIVGVWIPNWLGFALFTLGLTLALWTASLMGIAGLPILGTKIPLVGALGVLVGARVADTLVSHWLLYGLGYRPNPGLSSTPLFIVEAIFLLVTFRDAFSLDAAWEGFALGCVFFILVLPLLWTLRVVKPSWRRQAWTRRQTIPEWTKA